MRFTGQLKLKPVIPEINRLNAWLDAAIDKSGVQHSLGVDLKLCLNEVVINLISYAFATTSEPFIDIEIVLDDDVAKARVRDNGAYFDIRAWPTPTTPEDIVDAQIGGYGILLIRDRARSIDYERHDDVNCLTITCSTQDLDTGRQSP